MEAAGGAGLQLFVDSSVSVDSALIRQLVDEVLTEIVALMLGQRDSPDTRPEPGLEPAEPAAAQEQVETPGVSVTWLCDPSGSGSESLCFSSRTNWFLWFLLQ